MSNSEANALGRQGNRSPANMKIAICLDEFTILSDLAAINKGREIKLHNDEMIW